MKCIIQQVQNPAEIDFEKTYEKVKWHFLIVQQKCYGGKWCEWMLKGEKGANKKLEIQVALIPPLIKGRAERSTIFFAI